MKEPKRPIKLTSNDLWYISIALKNYALFKDTGTYRKILALMKDCKKKGFYFGEKDGT